MRGPEGGLGLPSPSVPRRPGVVEGRLCMRSGPVREVLAVGRLCDRQDRVPSLAKVLRVRSAGYAQSSGSTRDVCAAQVIGEEV